jgi:hypothetical protein
MFRPGGLAGVAPRLTGESEEVTSLRFRNRPVKRLKVAPAIGLI